MLLYPNPTIGNIAIGLGEPFAEVQAEVLNIHGQVLVANTLHHSQTVKLEILGTAGFYFIEILVPGSQKATFKVLKE